MRFRPRSSMSDDEARNFLELLSSDPEKYLTDLLHAHHEALSDAQDMLRTNGWTRGEVLAFCVAADGLDPPPYPHQDCMQRLGLILSGSTNAKRAEKLVEDPDTWCDRCDEIARDGLLGVALVNIWRAWRLNNDGPLGQWIDSLPKESPRNL